MMLQLLQKNIFNLFNTERPGGTLPLVGPPTIIYEDTHDKLFDIDDPKGKVSPICVVHVGKGQSTYHNEEQLKLRVINYEAFVNLFTMAKIDKNGRSRVDFMVYDTDVTKSCFILNELTTGTFQNKRSKARLQLQNTIHDLMKDTDTRAYISSFNKKQCILSCRKEPEPISPFDMAAGFTMAVQIIPKNSTFSAKSIERLGFECIENDHIFI